MLLAACGSPAAPAPSVPAPQQKSEAGAYRPQPLTPPVKITVTDSSVSSQTPLYVAADRGYFKDEGLDVELVPGRDASTNIQMVALNQVNFVITNPDPVTFNALDRGVDIKILASATVNKETDRPAVLMVRQDLIDAGKYKGPADLKGLNVAAGAPNALFYVDRFLSQGGLTLKDVNIVNVRVQDVLATFRNKGIDAGWETEPLATETEKEGLAKTAATTGQLYPNAVAAALMMSPQFGKDQPEAARHFAIAYLRGLRDYWHAFNNNGADRGLVIQSLTAHTPVKDPALYSVIGLPSFDPNASTDPTPSWSAFQDFFIKQGLQQHKVDTSKYVDFSLVNAAVDKLGRL
jgi:NitT/TauT family transport system substrate-binding protein